MNANGYCGNLLWQRGLTLVPPVARTANGIRQSYEYDGRGQLLAVKNADGTDAERYAYDKAGNMVKKMILRAGRAVSTKPPQSEDYQTTTFTFDGANQLVSSTTDGVTTKYAYDAAGRLVKEGSKTYRYGYLDKVLSVTDGKDKYTYTYHVDGQLARATYVSGGPQSPATESEDFQWDGLALIQRGGARFINEPHIGGGNPIVSSKGTSYFNDMLGTTLGAKAKGKKYSAAALTAFGEDLSAVNFPNLQTLKPSNSQTFYTGKPYVAGLGHAFLFRNYRAGLAKWQTADPLGYPDGWNQLAYGVNAPLCGFDLFGGAWGNAEFVAYYFLQDPERPNRIDTDVMELTYAVYQTILPQVRDWIDSYVRLKIIQSKKAFGNRTIDPFGATFGVNCGSVCWAMGGGTGRLNGVLTFSWRTAYYVDEHIDEAIIYNWSYSGSLEYLDIFRDPVDIFNWFEDDLEAPGGRPYIYGHIWSDVVCTGKGMIIKRVVE